MACPFSLLLVLLFFSVLSLVYIKDFYSFNPLLIFILLRRSFKLRISIFIVAVLHLISRCMPAMRDGQHSQLALEMFRIKVSKDRVIGMLEAALILCGGDYYRQG